jgi:CRP/FNR family transcriptional regulator, cyclic AMP receptor protein
MIAVDQAAAPAVAPDDAHPSCARLLDVLPDLRRAVPADDRVLARRALVVPVAEAADGSLAALLAPVDGHVRRAVVLQGVVLRNTSLDTRVVTEILGEGDIIDARDDLEPSQVATTTQYVVHRPAVVAFLDERFRAAARRWPELHEVINQQLERQRRRASTHLAILQLPRVDTRIHAMFSLLADRWGRVTPEGIVVDLALTHELIGHLVGGRRPTVTLALAELNEAGALIRRGDGTWLLTEPTGAAA